MTNATESIVARRIARIRRAILLLWVGWLVYFVTAIIVLNVITVPSRLPWWFLFFVVAFVAPAILTPVLRSRIIHLEAEALKQELRKISDELE